MMLELTNPLTVRMKVRFSLQKRKYFYEIPDPVERCIFSVRRRVFVCHPEVEERRLVGLAHILRTKTIFTGEGVQTTL